AVFFVMLRELSQAHWIATARRLSLGATMALTIISGVHYVILAGQRMRAGHGTGASAA
ncbi:MAG: hypothetical protein JO187_04985, partial [Acidobacteria bacterium]|nr:hypothetical protein [Acidobacteriota bacterium]